jgi:hypothetical protein
MVARNVRLVKGCSSIPLCCTVVLDNILTGKASVRVAEFGVETKIHNKKPQFRFPDFIIDNLMIF